ncbi:MAG: heme exporter protein CcmD [Maricaulis sp.]|jgi:heme exporter protein CcmD|nr:heme exporter protein CcmD [Maricaulis sp.]HAQ35397.1 heme exporter protein CcmD [Alphaproteobacteria bacterium]|tara:strand:- start:5 stop:160 length:156 start_codon:yes stop_codon:yes gene_type:complete
MSELFAFSHPAFVWSSYALAALGAGGLVVWVLAERKAVEARLAREEAARQP